MQEGKAQTHTRRTQLERRADAESRLLHAARAIVAEKGWTGMTLAEVGEAAGYSRGLAAHHFGNKAGLLRALAAYVNTCFAADLKAMSRRREGEVTLKGIIQAYFSGSADSWTNNRALLALLSEAVTQEGECREILVQHTHGNIEYLTRLIETGMASGDMRSDITAPAAAALILGVMRGVMLQHLLKPDEAALGAIQEQLLCLIDMAFAAPAAKAPGSGRRQGTTHVID
ncbi:TetR/AcrR family transcriptional regulator [Pseudomonas sp. NPDC089569]|uniref:TetR/AcrR family transcriptional regulator n=1 Tax=Pseudomonas sp. NPDC089569 TaxID=3390722 RepID=UPI003CFCB4CE